MTDLQGKKGSKGPHNDNPVVFRLYIAGRAPNSMQARLNLEAICEEFFPENHRIEIVDVLEDPQRAIADDILATPTLVKVSPLPVRKIIGNLSEKTKVLHSLELGDGIA